MNSKGHSQREIANILRLSLGSVARDLKYLRQQSKSGTLGSGTAMHSEQVGHLNPEVLHQEQFKEKLNRLEALKSISREITSAKIET